MNFLPLLKEEEGKNKKKKKKQQLQQNKYITNTKRGTITTTTITRCPHFSPFNPTNPFIFSPADSVFKDEDLEPLSATTLISSWGTDCGYDEYSSDTDRAWSMRSFLPILPDSPSPLCTPTSPSPSYSSHYSSPSLISTQTNKMSCIESRVEVDEWLDSAKDLFQSNLQKRQQRVAGMDEESPSMKLPTIICEERRGGEEGQVDIWSTTTGDYRLLTRPKPYHAFLDEIRKQEAEAQVGASRRAAQFKFMKKLKGKEAAIREWESRKTQIAMSEMKKVEAELEKRRSKALEKMEKKISKAQKKANKKKVKERRSIFKKISRAIKTAEIEATKKSTRCFTATVTSIC